MQWRRGSVWGGTEWGDVGKVLSRKEEGEFMAWLRKLEVILGRLT